MNIDLITSLFQICAIIFQLDNIVKLYRDKDIKGVSLYIFILYTIWAVWNLYYYMILQQSLSFIIGIFTVIVNLIWISLAVYYKNNKLKQ